MLLTSLRRALTRGSVLTDDMVAALVCHIVLAVEGLPQEAGNPEIVWVPRGVDETGGLVVRCGERQHILGPLPHFNPFVDRLRQMDREHETVPSGELTGRNEAFKNGPAALPSTCA